MVGGDGIVTVLSQTEIWDIGVGSAFGRKVLRGFGAMWRQLRCSLNFVLP